MKIQDNYANHPYQSIFRIMDEFADVFNLTSAPYACGYVSVMGCVVDKLFRFICYVRQKFGGEPDDDISSAPCGLIGGGEL